MLFLFRDLCYSFCLVRDLMRSLHPWPIFPANLDPPNARSLSLQFILQELIGSFDHLLRLQKITPEYLQGANIKEELSGIAQELEKFLLFSLENPFAQKGGFLDKLCFYCEILIQASHVADPDLQMILEEMRNSFLRLKSKLFAWKKMSALHPLDEIISCFLEIYADLHHKLCRFFSALSPFLQEARSDENVLFYLLEQRLQLNHHLGDRVVEHLFLRLFPAGITQLRAVLCEGYTRRGFASVFAQAEPLIEALKWENVPLPNY